MRGRPINKGGQLAGWTELEHARMRRAACPDAWLAQLFYDQTIVLLSLHLSLTFLRGLTRARFCRSVRLRTS